MVSEVFADTSYFLALSIQRDRFHRQALLLDASLNQRFLTTEWVLAEVADALAGPATRSRFAALVRRLKARDATIVPASSRDFTMGCALYMHGMDKGWSLSDCISFIVMRRHGIKSALTSGRHFTQAGFQILMGAEASVVAESTAFYGAEPVPLDGWQPSHIRGAA